MSEIKKAALVEAQAVSDEELALINRQSLKTLAAEAVFTFKLAACDNEVDRDNERFTDGALGKLAQLYVGRTVICDHSWLASKQTARVYAAQVEDIPTGVKRLVLRCYMLRSEQAQPTIDAIEGGIMRECSVGCAVSQAKCSICGTDRAVKACGHRPGTEYNGKRCHVDLDGVTDAYEVSFVAVPAQPAAGIVKTYGGENTPADGEGGRHEQGSELGLRLRLLSARAKYSAATIGNPKIKKED